MPDSLVEESRETREQLLRELGGLDGLCTKLEEMDRERERRQAAESSHRAGNGRQGGAVSVGEEVRGSLEMKRPLQVVSGGNRRAFAHGGTWSGIRCGASWCRAEAWRWSSVWRI